MKRGLILFLAALMCLSLFAACGSTPEELIARGDRALEERDYEQALSYYRQAGSAGTEKQKQVHIINARALNRNHESYDKSLEYLLEKASQVITEEEAHVILTEYLAEELAEMEKSLAEKDSLDEKNVKYYNSTIREMLENATDVIKEGTPGLKEAVSKANNLRAEVSLKSYGPDYEWINWKYALEDWNQCTDGKGYEVQQAVTMIREGEYIAGMERLTEILENETLAASLYQEISAGTKFETIEQILECNAALRSLYPDDGNQTLTEAFTEASELKVGTSSMEDSMTLSNAMVDELKAKCGLVPDGKILILHKPDITKDGLDLAAQMMQYLPDRYYPTDLKSVEYVIVLSAEDVLTGQTYDKGTKQVREDITMDLYDAKYGSKILTMTEKGPVNMFITYYGDPPEYYSAGAANVRQILLNAFTMIENN